MSFKEKTRNFESNSSNINKENEITDSQKYINCSSSPKLANKNINNKLLVKSFRNTISNVIQINKMTNKAPKYNDPDLDKLNSLEKIIKLQEDLKIVASIKQQFETNQNKMIEKINKFCSNYYKNKINMQKIFDYCSNTDAETNYEYNLLTTEQAKEVLKSIYNDVFDFIFLIRNDNRLMLKIIENCEKEGYQDVSNFLINYCYEDTINSSFIQEDMLILVYLLIERCIIKILPTNEELKGQNQNEIDIYGKYIKNNILYYIFLSLTRKADIRNYLCSILSEKIIKIENFRSPLTVEIGLISDYLNSLDERKRQLAENRNTTFNPGKYKGNSGYLKRLSASSSFLELKKAGSNKKFSSRLTLQNPQFPEFLNKNNDEIIENDDKNLIIKSSLSKSNLKNRNQSEKNLGSYNDLILDDNKEEGCKLDIVEIEEEEFENDNNEENDTFDSFFTNTETTLKYINNKIKEYEKSNEPNKTKSLDSFSQNTISAMKEYLSHLIKNLDKEEIKIEKYSNMILINSLKASRNIKAEDNFNFIIDTIKANHHIIVEVITELLNIIKENLNSLPFFIKCILNSIDFLLDYKYKNNLTLYNKYMLKANFLLGNIIFPVLENPNYNGIITNEIISDLAKENLEIIASILKMMLSGNLFSINMNPCMTIYNQFIIEILPIVFEIVQKLEENFKLPQLIKGLTETINDIDDEKREINFDYFKENKDEKFHFQSICFSYSNMRNILNSVIKYYNKLIEEEKYIRKGSNAGEIDDKKKDKDNDIKEKIKRDIIERNIKHENFFTLIFNKTNKLSRHYKEFIYMSKITFLPSFQSKIKSILKDNFISLNAPIKEKFKEEEVSRFKKCLSVVLTYVNLIHKEYIPNFIHIKNENYIHDYNLIELLIKNKIKKKYQKIINEELYEDKVLEINTVEEEDKEDPDFKTEILPYILLNVQSELGSNNSDDFYQRILYCCSYLQLHIDLLPPDYILHNYKLLFVELIKDTESNIHILRNNILNQLNIKVKGSEKTNMIILNTYQQIKNMEKLKCIEYLYSKLKIPSKFIVPYSLKDGLIKNVQYIEKSSIMPLSSLFESIPDYRKHENDVEDIIDLEEKTNMGEALKNYFKNLKTVIRKEHIVKKYSKEDIESICNELENYMLVKLYEKLFPSKPTKEDIKFYNKCSRLDFVKPENLINDKNIVNENLWEASIKYINEIDKKFTPADKIKCVAKAFNILQNSITFCSGKNELGVDDTIKPLIYVLLKSKPEKIFSNFNYCQLYLDPDLSKKQYGILLTQICMIMNIIKDMKYTELINVTEEQFGKDEE